METIEIINKLKSGIPFYNPNTSSKIKFEVKDWDGTEKGVASVSCTRDDYTWDEHWDDMRYTISAFLIGEYRFLSN